MMQSFRKWNVAQLLTGQTASAAIGAIGRGPIEAPGSYYTIAVPNAASALVTFEASIDATGWLPIPGLATVTATNTTASGIISAGYPLVRARVNAVYSGGGITGFPFATIASP